MEGKCKLTVNERDMDLLFMHAFLTDSGFVDLFLRKAGIAGKGYAVLEVELSKTDVDLGETDITVILNDGVQKVALLIEDKINAMEMPQQQERYDQRGRLGIERGEYDDFKVFMVAPQLYLDSIKDKREGYRHQISYEEIAKYFRENTSAVNRVRAQQIEQALDKAKKQYQVTIHETAVASFKKYAAFQREHYPALDLRNRVSSERVNGWWPRFSTPYPGACVYHKTPQGFADLTFSGKAEKKPLLDQIAEKLRKNNMADVQSVATGKSVALRIKVPEINMDTKFEEWDMNNLDQCFDAIQRLVNIAEIIHLFKQFVE